MRLLSAPFKRLFPHHDYPSHKSKSKGRVEKGKIGNSRKTDKQPPISLRRKFKHEYESQDQSAAASHSRDDAA